YAVPNQDLAEVIDLREFPVQSINGGERHAINLRGKVVPVQDISYFLEGASNTPLKPDKNNPCPGIVVQHHDDWLTLLVERVVGLQQIFVRPDFSQLSKIEFYGGSTILADGEPAIILDLPAMVERYFAA